MKKTQAGLPVILLLGIYALAVGVVYVVIVTNGKAF